MEQSNDIFRMLDMMERPGFCVKEQVITKVNPAAGQLSLASGMEVGPLIHIGGDDYAAFAGGCLYLTLILAGKPCGATVSRVGDYDIFLPEPETDQAELQAMALAARELRGPLASVMATADRLFPMVADETDDDFRDQTARLNRGLYQLLRIVSNMSDAGRSGTASFHPEIRDIRGYLEEVFTKAGELVRQAGMELTFTNLPSPLFCLIDGEKLERAILNILSNAIKFTVRGSKIEARLVRRGSFLCLTVQDPGEGLAEAVRSSVFSRYARQPAIEDGRFGIGLGMVLIRSAAAQHGGTVLIDQPDGKGTRITMTLAIRQSGDAILRSPIARIDYAGDRDRGLIELSECLPAAAYDTHQVN